MSLEHSSAPINAAPGIYALLIALSVGGAVGRILAVNSVDQIRLEQHLRKDHNQPDRQLQRPFLSGNDRSRWLTMRALVEKGTFAIDELVCEPNWDTIDMVRHQDDQGRWRIYSSKPPLLPVIMAGQYWLIHKLTGATLGTHPFEIGRIMLITWNVLPWWILLACTASLLQRYATNAWAGAAAMAILCFGTLLTPFLTVLNNHLHAAAAFAVVLWAVVRINSLRPQTSYASWAVAGAGCALAFASELPAAVLFPAVGVWLLSLSFRHTLLVAMPASALILVPYFGLNYWAHGSWSPPYAHRKDGPALAHVNVDEETFAREWLIELSANRLPNSAARLSVPVYEISQGTVVEPCLRAPANTKWNLFNPTTQSRARLVREADSVTLRAWDDWYDYDYECGGKKRQSYWRDAKNQAIVDQGEPNVLLYAVHCLMGHHGIFSLTPIWLLLPWSWLLTLREKNECLRGEQQALAAIACLATSLCLAFYLSRPLVDRNYGGTSSALRWMLWLIPVWIVTLVPLLNQIAHSAIGRRCVYVLCGLGMISASYPTWNPWTHPWLAQWMAYLGWIKL